MQTTEFEVESIQRQSRKQHTGVTVSRTIGVHGITLTFKQARLAENTHTVLCLVNVTTPVYLFLQYLVL